MIMISEIDKNTDFQVSISKIQNIIILKAIMYKTAAHQSIKVNCTMDEPIQLLIDKLSTKSSDLYIFWQNYDQLYRQYNEKVNQNNMLKQQIEHLKKNMNKFSQHTEIKRDNDDGYLKERLKSAQSNLDVLKNQVDKLKNGNRDLKIENSRFIEEINQMQTLITQLREQNSLQRNSIANILQKLKIAQAELNNRSKLVDQLEQKDLIVAKLIQKDKQTRKILQQKDEEIEQLGNLCRETKTKYEKIIKESLQNAKESVLASLPLQVRQSMKKGEYR